MNHPAPHRFYLVISGPSKSHELLTDYCTVPRQLKRKSILYFTVYNKFDYYIVTNVLKILQKKFKRLKRIEDEDSDAEDEDVQGQIRKEIFEGSGDVRTH